MWSTGAGLRDPGGSSHDASHSARGSPATTRGPPQRPCGFSGPRVRSRRQSRGASSRDRSRRTGWSPVRLMAARGPRGRAHRRALETSRHAIEQARPDHLSCREQRLFDASHNESRSEDRRRTQLRDPRDRAHRAEDQAERRRSAVRRAREHAPAPGAHVSCVSERPASPSRVMSRSKLRIFAQLAPTSRPLGCGRDARIQGRTRTTNLKEDSASKHPSVGSLSRREASAHIPPSDSQARSFVKVSGKADTLAYVSGRSLELDHSTSASGEILIDIDATSL